MDTLNNKYFIMIYIMVLAILSVCQISYGEIDLDILAGSEACERKLKCGECIQTQHCSWCSQPNMGNRPRCFVPTLAQGNSHCDEEFVYNPDNDQLILSAKPLTGSKPSSSSSSWISSTSDSGSKVQVSPQRVALKSRINEPFHLNFAYAETEDFPVDLYFLLDLSKSLEDDREKISILADHLTEKMRNVTSRLRVGFGSFVEKVLMPYVSTVPRNLKEPCPRCAAPYGFRNHMRMSTDTTRFLHEMKNAPISGNLDSPNGGFDAIMQAIVCRNEIGWRDQARRIIVFVTDSGFHVAGDGKLGGVITPNDGQCHLDNEGLYTHSSILDYPSISQINMKVTQNAINIIFAVTANKIEEYRRLSNNILGSSSAILEDNPFGVIDLVLNEYNKISSSVDIRDTSSSNIEIKYSSSSLYGVIKDTNKCSDLRAGDTVNFVAEITVKSCPPNRKDWKQTFQIYPVGMNESLTVDLEMFCECDCENPLHILYEPKSQHCHGDGTFKCGICECDEHSYGHHCECSIYDESGHFSAGCRMDNNTMTDCSGRGTCICDICECDKRSNSNEIINGRYCECDNFSCDRHNGDLCSGPSHGVCDCGACICSPGWVGSACECSTNLDTCMNNITNQICSNHGICECGECRCHRTKEGRYSGAFCEKCPTCA